MHYHEYFLFQRICYVPVSIAFVLIALSWLKFWFFLKYDNYENKVKIWFIISFVLNIATVIFILAYGYYAAQDEGAYFLCSFMFLYIAVLFVVSVLKVLKLLQNELPNLHRLYSSRLKINAIIAGLALFLRFLLNLYIAYTFRELNSTGIHQINQLIQNVICEIIPILLTFFSNYVDIRDHKLSYRSAVLDSYEVERDQSSHEDNSLKLYRDTETTGQFRTMAETSLIKNFKEDQ